MKNEELKVSIISGVYNAEKYLRECVDSMLAQSYKNIEIILVVNASVDSSEEIVMEYVKRYPDIVQGFYMEKKLGAGGSRKFGMECATGDYICFVDCDDWIEKDYISNMISIAEKQKLLPDIVVCNFKKINEKGQDIYIRRFKNKEQALVQGVAPWGKMFKKAYMQEKGLTLRNIPFGEDVIFAAELFLTDPYVAITDYVGYVWRDNPKSTSHTELGGFPKDTILKSTEYFNYMHVKYKEKEKTLSYFILKYYVWYLLQSGRKVKKEDMKREYEKSFGYLNTTIKDWNKFGSKNRIFIKGERGIVSLVLLAVRILEKLHLSKSFFLFYSQSILGRMWPSL